MNSTTTILFTSAMLLALAAPGLGLRAANMSMSPSPSPSANAAGPATMSGTQTKASTSTAGASPGGNAERAIPFYGTISSVDAKAKTFSIAGKQKTRTFKITDKTVITKSGQPATLKDVAAKEEARGSYWKMPDGSMELKTLKVGPATEQEKAAAEQRNERRSEKKAAASGSPGASASPSGSASPQ